MQSSKKNFAFIEMTADRLAQLVSRRNGEQKLGEYVQVGSANNASFQILGICEDVGPRANCGNAGATEAFDAFLTKFLNMQSNRFLSGEDVAIVGFIQFTSGSTQLSDLRDDVVELDAFVEDVLSILDLNKKQLIVIGGGHNNAYPILRSFQSRGEALQVLNIDPHADCRPLEGRHSGNPFSAAILEKRISSYTVFGLHQQYNSASILHFLEEHGCQHTFFEDYLKNNTLLEDVAAFVEKRKDASLGIEIDLDCIEYMPTSAMTPSGFRLNEIRSLVQVVAKQHVKYLHLPEGAPTNPHEKQIVGKALAYLVSDFIKNAKN